MKIALISDIHGNLEALTSVLKDIEKQKVDVIHCLGDVIGYGCEPSACLKLVEDNCDVKLMGNHEYAVLGLISTDNYNSAAREAALWTKDQLSEDDINIIQAFSIEHDINKDIKLVHASPQTPDQWLYVLSSTRAFDAFMYFQSKICFFGHTHLPQIYTEREDDVPRCQIGHDFLPNPESRYLINVGSVGQPRDNDPRACYLTFDTDEYEIQYHRIKYDINTAQEKMLKAELPEMLISRLSVGR